MDNFIKANRNQNPQLFTKKIAKKHDLSKEKTTKFAGIIFPLSIDFPFE